MEKNVKLGFHLHYNHVLCRPFTEFKFTKSFRPLKQNIHDELTNQKAVLWATVHWQSLESDTPPPVGYWHDSGLWFEAQSYHVLLVLQRAYQLKSKKNYIILLLNLLANTITIINSMIRLNKEKSSDCQNISSQNCFCIFSLTQSFHFLCRLGPQNCRIQCPTWNKSTPKITGRAVRGNISCINDWSEIPLNLRTTELTCGLETLHSALNLYH